MTTPILPETLRRPFGRTGLSVSPLGFGGAPIGVLETERDTVGRVLNDLLDAGVNLIDTAAMYRGSEAMIGATIGARRDEYVLVSKVGHAIEETEAEAWSPELIRASVERSLSRLGVDHVDVMLLHSCDLEVLERGDALAALVREQEKGHVRFVGYSGDNEALAWAAARPEISVLQTSINLCDQVNVDLGLPVARTHDCGVMVKRPIANAPWKGTDGQYEAYRSYGEPYVERFRAMGLALEPLRPLGYEGDWPELALRFALGVPGVSVAIVGTTRPDHVAANLEAAGKGPLPEAVVAHLREAFAAGAAKAEEEWPGLT